MKLALTLPGVILLVLAATYFLVPVDQLPGFMPAHQVGVTWVQVKHGFASGELGLILIATAVWMGRK
jgi:hypothetical protein